MKYLIVLAFVGLASVSIRKKLPFVFKVLIKKSILIILFYVILCYVILDYIILYYIILCYVVLCYVMLCYVMLCYVMLCYVAVQCYVALLSGCGVLLYNAALCKCYVILLSDAM